MTPTSPPFCQAGEQIYQAKCTAPFVAKSLQPESWQHPAFQLIHLQACLSASLQWFGAVVWWFWRRFHLPSTRTRGSNPKPPCSKPPSWGFLRSATFLLRIPASRLVRRQHGGIFQARHRPPEREARFLGAPQNESGDGPRVLGQLGNNHLAMGHNLWLHFGVERGTGFDPQPFPERTTHFGWLPEFCDNHVSGLNGLQTTKEFSAP